MVKVTPTGAGVTIQSDELLLEGIIPVVNGRPVSGWQGEWQAGEYGRIERSGKAESVKAVFGVSLEPDEENGGWRLIYWVEDFPLHEHLDSFGIYFTQVSGCQSVLRSGYFSWDGSAYIDPGQADENSGFFSPTGYSLAQFAGAGGSFLVLGFDRHDRYQQTFTFAPAAQSLSLTILTLWDRKERIAQTPVESELLMLIPSSNADDGLRAWARRVAAASPIPPRGVGSEEQHPPRLSGWSSWYNLYAAITEENLRDHLAAAAQANQTLENKMRVFQIDDGFTPEMGDWLEVKPQFPKGMKPLLDEIRAAGLIPGLWIAPFMVGNRSRLYQQHPGWVVQDAIQGGPLVQMQFYGEFRWHKRSEEYYILDISHPDAYEYIASVFRTWRREWGCEYFKTDFMHFGSEHGPERAVWHTPGSTRIEVWRSMAKLIRQEIGDALWLGCGCPLWASVGMVDAVRIGSDTGVEWEATTAAIFANQLARTFPHGILWQADPDCILLRHRFHNLTAAEQESLAIFAGLMGGLQMTSDHLGELSPECLALWEMILGWTGEACRYPQMEKNRLLRTGPLPAGKSKKYRSGFRLEDPLVMQVKPLPGSEAEAEETVLFLLNTGDQPMRRQLRWDEVGIKTGGEYSTWRETETLPQGEGLDIELAPHSGKLFFVRPKVRR